MHSIHSRIHVEYRAASLAREACIERLAAEGRRSHEEEHVSHPTLDHRHERTGVRGTIGRLLIGVGTAIAGSASDGSARRAA